MDKFRGRPAFVTGGASGIGLAIGRELARREMKVALADNDADTLKMACSGLPGSVAIALDTTDASRWGPALDEAEAELGPLAVLVVNAGVAGSQLPITETSPAVWEWTRGINLDGTFLALHHGVPRLTRTGMPSHVIATASLAAMVVWERNGPYSATKAAMVALCETLRAELATTEVGVSVLLPSLVNTAILERNAARAPTGVCTGECDPELEGAMRAGLDPDIVARMAADAIGTGAFWIVTHPETRELVRARAAEIDAALERAQAALVGSFSPGKGG